MVVVDIGVCVVAPVGIRRVRVLLDMHSVEREALRARGITLKVNVPVAMPTAVTAAAIPNPLVQPLVDDAGRCLPLAGTDQIISALTGRADAGVVMWRAVITPRVNVSVARSTAEAEFGSHDTEIARSGGISPTSPGRADRCAAIRYLRLRGCQ